MQINRGYAKRLKRPSISELPKCVAWFIASTLDVLANVELEKVSNEPRVTAATFLKCVLIMFLALES